MTSRHLHVKSPLCPCLRLLSCLSPPFLSFARSQPPLFPIAAVVVRSLYLLGHSYGVHTVQPGVTLSVLERTCQRLAHPPISRPWSTFTKLGNFPLHLSRLGTSTMGLSMLESVYGEVSWRIVLGSCVAYIRQYCQAQGRLTSLPTSCCSTMGPYIARASTDYRSI